MFLEKQYINRIKSRFNIFKDLGNNSYRCNCPFCGNSSDNRKLNFNIFYADDKFRVKCFKCGYSNSLLFFIKDIDFNLFSEYKLERLKLMGSNYKETEKLIDLKTEVKFDFNILSYVTKLSETNNNQILDYVKGRKIPIEYFQYLYVTEDINEFSSKIEKYKDQVYQKGLALVLPAINKDNQVSMIQTRFIDDKLSERMRFQTFSIIEDDPSIFNEHLLDRSQIVNVTEGPIDSMCIKNCCSLFGAGNKTKINYLLKEYKNIRMIIDNDYSSNKSVLKVLNDYIKLGLTVIIYDQKFKGLKDLNDAIKSERFDHKTLMTYIEDRSFSGMRAQLELANQLK